jgi:hypothetical protein
MLLGREGRGQCGRQAQEMRPRIAVAHVRKRQQREMRALTRSRGIRCARWRVAADRLAHRFIGLLKERPSPDGNHPAHGLERQRRALARKTEDQEISMVTSGHFLPAVGTRSDSVPSMRGTQDGSRASASSTTWTDTRQEGWPRLAVAFDSSMRFA